MRNFIAKFCFYYGCLASVGALVWYLAILAGSEGLPQSVLLVETVAVIYIIVMIITFSKSQRSAWEPVVQVTRRRIIIGKVLLLIASLNFLFCTALIVWENRAVSSSALSMGIASFALLNAVYLAIHWALRPENLFPGRFLLFISNPLVYILFHSSLSRQFTRSKRSDAK
jgi:hypothetical protein